MRIVLFYHTLVSDWNHGNAHFLRGIATELIRQGHEVAVFEPRDSWSRQCLVSEHGRKPLRAFRAAYPGLKSVSYDWKRLNLDRALREADLVVVHEWNSPELIRRLGEHRVSAGGYRLLFHDTHHRMATDPAWIEEFPLANYDGVLAYGRILQEKYLDSGRVARAWVWHEAADTRLFYPRTDPAAEGDLVWVGNWGDDERTAELREYLIEPARSLKLKTRVYGVRYPEEARKELAGAGIRYEGWLPNFEAPNAYARHRMTVHIPRRPYVKVLPGIPTIRMFEALACGIPLICSPWEDTEGLFRAGEDFLAARNGREMRRHMKELVADEARGRSLAAHGWRTICSRHTCAHRVAELIRIAEELGIRKDGK